MASVEVRHNALAYLKLAIARLDEAEGLLRETLQWLGSRDQGTVADPDSGFRCAARVEEFLGSDNG